MPLLTVDEVARLLKIRVGRTYELCRSGILPVVRVGRQVRVDGDSLREWIKAGGSGLDEVRARQNDDAVGGEP